MIDVIELPIQEKIRMLGEKETFNYLVMLESGNIKQVEKKENIKMSISGERENYLKPCYVAEISSKA